MQDKLEVYDKLDLLVLKSNKLFDEYVSVLAFIADELDQSYQDKQLLKFHRVLNLATTKLGESIDELERLL